MTSAHDDNDAALAEERLLELARAAISDAEMDLVWRRIIGDSPLPNVSDQLRDQAFQEASLALQIGRGELSLGRYISSLRTAAKLTRQQVGSGASLSAHLVGELEAGEATIKSIEPSRLGRIAAQLHAARRVFLALTVAAISVRPERGDVQPRLTRLDTPSPIESERALRRSAVQRDEISDDEYLAKVAIAYDAELEKMHPPSAP
jgi:hypothetical protein